MTMTVVTRDEAETTKPDGIGTEQAFGEAASRQKPTVAPGATPENKQTEAMLADLVKNVFGDKKFKFHRTDPQTGKRETVELGGER